MSGGVSRHRVSMSAARGSGIEAGTFETCSWRKGKCQGGTEADEELGVFACKTVGVRKNRKISRRLSPFRKGKTRKKMRRNGEN